MAEEKSQEQKICERMDLIGRKILIMSGKGGVGKTTVTVNIANALLKMGKTVGILDTDIHGPNVAKMLGCEGKELLNSTDGVSIEPVSPREGLKVVSLSFALQDPDQAVIFRGPMKMSVINQFLADVNWGVLDYLLIDSPPGTGDEQLAILQGIPAMTGTIIVTTPQQVAILDARRSVSFANQLDTRILGVIENMSYLECPTCKEKLYIFGKDGGKNMCMELGVPLIGQIPMETELQKAEDEGKTYEGHASEVFSQIAHIIDSSTQPSCSADVGYVPKGPGCSPESCATCTLDCPSKKK